MRHEGAVRTAPDGKMLRLSMISHRVRAEAIGETSSEIRAALVAQDDVLKTLANELGAPLAAACEGSSHDQLGAGLADLARLLAGRAGLVSDSVEALARARHVADDANLAKSQFLANMSHELRTPLNAIIGYTEILREDAEVAGEKGVLQDLNRILTAAKHLQGLINEILDLSKIEAGRVEVAATTFDPAEMIDELAATMAPLAAANRNAIALRRPTPEGFAVTDATKLRQCVLNLLSNACKFTCDGHIEITYERRQYEGAEHMFIMVRDTGIGMSGEHMARLFQPFVQAHPSITQQYGGTGLGLTITRRLAQLLGGDVDVSSTLGEGAVFTLHVPLNIADAAAESGATAEVDNVQGPHGAPLVVVIEDEPDARDLAARALTRAGFAVQGVGGGEAGLALVRAKSPALVLLDIYLPDRSGWRVLQALKHDAKTQDIPVIVLSVNEDRAHALSLGAAEHIIKPVERDILAAMVMRYARKRPAEAPAPASSLAPTPHKQAG